MGVLLVTPLVLAFPDLFKVVGKARRAELGALLALLTTACFLIFSDRLLFTLRLHVLAFAVFPFVIWAAIPFGVSGCGIPKGQGGGGIPPVPTSEWAKKQVLRFAQDDKAGGSQIRVAKS